MGSVARVLGELDDEARARVLRWAAERYGVSVGTTAKARPGGAAPGSENVSEEEISAEAPEYEHFAELFNAAKPKTDVDKALVAGYWIQAIQRQPSFQAAELTKELRNLGHGLGNVTESLSANQAKKPARILQLKKSGSARQARKTYKLTHEGLVYVQGMIGHGG